MEQGREFESCEEEEKNISSLEEERKNSGERGRDKRSRITRFCDPLRDPVTLYEVKRREGAENTRFPCRIMYIMSTNQGKSHVGPRSLPPWGAWGKSLT